MGLGFPHTLTLNPECIEDSQRIGYLRFLSQTASYDVVSPVQLLVNSCSVSAQLLLNFCQALGQGPAQLPEQGQRAAGRGEQGAERLPGDEAAGVPAVLLPVQRRAAGDPLRDQGGAVQVDPSLTPG